MSGELLKYISKLKQEGMSIGLNSIADVITREKLEFDKDEIIQVLFENRFFGDYYTPNNAAELMAMLGKLSNPKNIIDICCGIGNILSYCDYADSVDGIDINEKAVGLAKVINPQAKIEVGDSLKMSFKKKYDLVFGDFPFGMRIKKDNKVFYAETLFIRKALSILKKSGVLICIVPNGFLFNDRFFKIRTDILVRNNLKLIIYLPGGIIPNTSIRSSLLYIENSPPEDEVYMVDYKENTDEIISSFIEEKGEFYASNDSLRIRWDRDYHDPGFNKIEKELKGKDVKYLEKIAEVIPGYSPKQNERLGRGEYLIFGGRNIKDSALRLTKQDSYINQIDKPSFRRAVLKPGDITISLLFRERKLYVYKEDDPKAVLSSSCALIRSPHSEYILTYLETKEGQKLFLKQAERATDGDVIPRLSLRDLKKIKIPILTLDNSKRISDREIKYSTTEELKELLVDLEEVKKKKFDSLLEKFKGEIVANLESKISDKEISYKIKGGETKKLEFKSSLRWNIRSNSLDKEIENGVLKTMVAFCNSEGGELLIGVDDNGNILGIELKLENFKNEDKFLLHLSNIINQRIMPPVNEFIDFKIIDVDDKKICQIVCKKSVRAIWFKSSRDKDEQFFVRAGPSSRQLSPIRAITYIEDHF